MAKTISKIVKYGLLCLVTIGAGFAAGYLVSNYTNRLSPDEEKFLDEYRLLKDEWLFGNETDYLEDLVAQGIIALPSSYLDDPYTLYTSSYEEQGLSTDHLGLGFTSHSYDGGLYVTEVHQGINEDKLKVGDVIYGCIKDENPYYDFTSHSSDEITAYLSEDVDDKTTYEMSILRDGEMITATLQRSEYEERYVDLLEAPSDENNNTLVIRINTFLGSPATSVMNILKQYQNQKINNLVIDLRENTGGLVSQAEALAKLFVKKGTLIYQFRDKDNKITDEVYQRSDPTYQIPHYSLIIDGYSASASEAFALAMRAGTDCTVYGLKSYGKGIAQEFKTFSDGSVVRYTSSYVYGPEKENETMYDEGSDADDVMCIHKKGIMPDEKYPLDYIYLNQVVDYTDSIYISEDEGEFLLKMLVDCYPDRGFPTSYSSSYTFIDAIEDITSLINDKYKTNYEAFDEDGTVSKAVNDKIIKESYDYYLNNYDALTEMVVSDD